MDAKLSDLIERLNDPARRLVVSDRQEAAHELELTAQTEKEALHACGVYAKANESLRDILRRFRDYACTDKVSMGGAHHDPIWQEVAVAIDKGAAQQDGNPNRRCAHGKLFTESCAACGYTHPAERDYEANSVNEGR